MLLRVQQIPRSPLFFMISIGSSGILSYYHSNSTSVPEQELMSALEFEYEEHLRVRTYLSMGQERLRAVELRRPTVKASATKMQISARIAMNINFKQLAEAWLAKTSF
uniref:Uncharacterized protein n=1 Tax=Populus alba TaxID=43335 RepID=A0A4V6A938_POPAL|nr:hypothetical protein D5086_0000136530 [Populus alba]